MQKKLKHRTGELEPNVVGKRGIVLDLGPRTLSFRGGDDEELLRMQKFQGPGGSHARDPQLNVGGSVPQHCLLTTRHRGLGGSNKRTHGNSNPARLKIMRWSPTMPAPYLCRTPV